MNETRNRGKSTVQVVRDSIDRIATSAEDIHKSVAALPLDMLAKIEPLEETVGEVRRVQDQWIGAIYDLVRKINEEVTSLVGDLQKEAEKHEPAKKRTPPRQAARATKPAGTHRPAHHAA